MALAVACCVLMAVLWTAHEAQGPSSTPAATADLVVVTDGVDAGVLGTAIHGMKPPLDLFSLPRELVVETSRQALDDPPPPVPLQASAPEVGTDVGWAALAEVSRAYGAPPSQAGAWTSLRTPTGPPAA